ncbi:hypothetical protein FQR65_LT16345 [Abscondita terminalis]|nr:hypothetical protein FQR65_LT16345 [Abscondita terminalis]
MNAKKRTSKKQFLIYLKYLKENEILLTGKLVPSMAPDTLKSVWDNLCLELNSCGDGPTRTPESWKKVFREWKSVVRKKARENKQLNSSEEQLISLTGAVVVTGIEGGTELGVTSASNHENIESVLPTTSVLTTSEVIVEGVQEFVDVTEEISSLLQNPNVEPVHSKIHSKKNVKTHKNNHLLNTYIKGQAESQKGLLEIAKELENEILLTGKLVPSMAPDTLKSVWDNLCLELNSCGDGPTRTPESWKKVFREWKSVVRKKARENKQLNSSEEQLISLTGAVVVTGIEGGTELGVTSASNHENIESVLPTTSVLTTSEVIVEGVQEFVDVTEEISSLLQNPNVEPVHSKIHSKKNVKTHKNNHLLNTYIKGQAESQKGLLEIAKELAKRTSSDQYKIYLKYLQKHKSTMEISNEEMTMMCKELHSVKGARKSISQWRQTFHEWVSKTKKKAREIMRYRMQTGGGPAINDYLNDNEELLISLIKWISITGLNIPELGFFNAVPFKRCKTSNSRITFVFREWKSVVRKKARENKQLNSSEEQLISLTGAVVVTGIEGGTELGVTSASNHENIESVQEFVDVTEEISSLLQNPNVEPVHSKIHSKKNVKTHKNNHLLNTYIKGQAESQKGLLEIAKELAKRTSSDQYKIYLKYLQKHKSTMEISNEEMTMMCKELHSVKGARKSISQWRQTFHEWVSKTKKKAREIMRYRMQTGGGPAINDYLNDNEELLISLIKWISITGLNIPELGFFNAVPFKRCKTSNSRITFVCKKRKRRRLIYKVALNTMKEQQHSFIQCTASLIVAMQDFLNAIIRLSKCYI